MREIRFRAWNGTAMIYPPKETDSMIGSRIMTWDGRWYINGQFQDVQFMQFTGLKDNNGKEIYEGDIVQSKSAFSKLFGPITFENGTFVWMREPLGWDMENDPPEICLPERWGTVIGNIHENQELLKS